MRRMPRDNCKRYRGKKVTHGLFGTSSTEGKGQGNLPALFPWSLTPKMRSSTGWLPPDLCIGLDTFVQDDHFDATVLRLTGIGVVAGQGESLSIPHGGDPTCLDPVPHQVVFYRIRSPPGKGQVVV